MSVRGIPVQDLPENQDASVQETFNEVTKEVTPWQVEQAPEPKRRGRPPKPVDEEEVPGEPAADQGDGE